MKPLADRVAALAPGGRLVLEPGDHWLDAPLIVDKAITLVAGGPGPTRIRAAAPVAVVRVTPTGCLTLRGVTVAHVGPAPAAVLVVAGALWAMDCMFTGAVARPALVAVGGACGAVLACEVVRNGGAGVRLAGRSAIALADNRIADNVGHGLVYAGRAAGLARANHVEGNGADGVHVAGRAFPLLEANLVLGNGGAGMAFTGRSAAMAFGNLCQGNAGPGLNQSSTADPALDENTSLGNGRTGLGVAGYRTVTR